MDTDDLTFFNDCEAGLWFLVALILALLWQKHPQRAWQFFAGSIVFVFFGISDLIEAQTGAWWKPWWLFVWKVSCVIAMLALTIHYRRTALHLSPALKQNPSKIGGVLLLEKR